MITYSDCYYGAIRILHTPLNRCASVTAERWYWCSRYYGSRLSCFLGEPWPKMWDSATTQTSGFAERAVLRVSRLQNIPGTSDHRSESEHLHRGEQAGFNWQEERLNRRKHCCQHSPDVRRRRRRRRQHGGEHNSGELSCLYRRSRGIPPPREYLTYAENATFIDYPILRLRPFDQESTQLL